MVGGGWNDRIVKSINKIRLIRYGIIMFFLSKYRNYYGVKYQ